MQLKKHHRKLVNKSLKELVIKLYYLKQLAPYFIKIEIIKGHYSGIDNSNHIDNQVKKLVYLTGFYEKEYMMLGGDLSVKKK